MFKRIVPYISYISHISYLSVLLIALFLAAISPIIGWQPPTWFSLIIFLGAIGLSALALYFADKQAIKDISWSKALIALGLILILFLAFNKMSFLGERMYEMKYMSYVGPALKMAENHNPFLMVKQYLASPFRNPPAQMDDFSSFPILTWPLALLFYLFGSWFKVELIARGLMVFWGSGLLIAVYLAVKEFSNRIYALFPILFLAFNYLFHVISHKTVNDTPMLFFLFLSIYFLGRYLNSPGQDREIFWAGILSGLAVLSKIDALLIVVPIASVLIIYACQRFEKIFFPMTLFLFLSVSPWICFELFINQAPSYLGWLPFFWSSLGILGYLMILFLIYQKLSFLKRWLKGLAGMIWQKKISLLALIISLIGLAYLIIKLAGVQGMINNFLTDRRLIFNMALYRWMIAVQLKGLAHSSFFCLSILSLIGIFFYRKGDDKLKIFFLSLLAGAAVFLVVASKSIFFHNYYYGFFVITSYIFTGLFIPIFANLFSGRAIKIAVMMVLILLLGANISNDLKKVRGDKVAQSLNEKDYRQAIDYLKAHTRPEEGYWEGALSFPLSFYADRPGYPLTQLSIQGEDRLRERVEKKGLFRFLKEEKIVYYVRNITRDPRPDWLRLAYLLEGKTEEYRFDRGAKVLEALALQKEGIGRDFVAIKTKQEYTQEENELLAKYQFKKHLIPEAIIGRFQFYRIKP